MSRRRVLTGCLLVVCLMVLGRPAAASQDQRQLASSAMDPSRGTSLPTKSDRDASRPVGPLVGHPTGAALVSEYQTAERAEEGSLYWDVIRSILMLAVVLALLGLGAKLLRRFPALTGRGHSLEGLQLLGRVSLTPKEAICLVRIGPTGGAPVESVLLVVGVGASGLTLLHRVRASGESRPRCRMTALCHARQPRGPSRAFRLRDLVVRIREAQTARSTGGLPREWER